MDILTCWKKYPSRNMQTSAQRAKHRHFSLNPSFCACADNQHRSKLFRFSSRYLQCLGGLQYSQNVEERSGTTHSNRHVMMGYRYVVTKWSNHNRIPFGQGIPHANRWVYLSGGFVVSLALPRLLGFLGHCKAHLQRISHEQVWIKPPQMSDIFFSQSADPKKLTPRTHPLSSLSDFTCTN